MAGWVECFLHEPQGLSSEPQRPPKKPGIVADTCIPTTWEAETDVAWGLVGQPV